MTLSGARIDSSGQARLAAGRDLLIGSQAITTEQHLTGQGSAGQSRFDRSAVAQRASEITTGGNLSLAAQRDLALIGSRVETQGNLAAVAGQTYPGGGKQVELLIDVREKSKNPSTGKPVWESYLQGNVQYDLGDRSRTPQPIRRAP